jgi:YfiR/HmsC-like
MEGIRERDRGEDVNANESFAERGGVINFILENNRVRFEINPSAAARVHLKISSKLLQLAVIVGSGK